MTDPIRRHLTALATSAVPWPSPPARPRARLLRRRLRQRRARSHPLGVVLADRGRRRLQHDLRRLREGPRGHHRRLQAFKNDRVQQDPYHRTGRLGRPRRPAGALLRPAPAHHRLRALVPLDGKVDLSSWDANVRQERQGQAGRQALRRAARPAGHSMFYNKDLFEKNGLTPPTTWDAVHGPTPSSQEHGHHAHGRRRQGHVDAADRAPGAGRAPLRWRRVPEGRDERPEGPSPTPTGWPRSKVLRSSRSSCPRAHLAWPTPTRRPCSPSGKAAMFPGGSFELGVPPEAEPAAEDGRLRGAAGPAARPSDRSRRRPATPTALRRLGQESTPRPRRARSW